MFSLLFHREIENSVLPPIVVTTVAKGIRKQLRCWLDE